MPKRLSIGQNALFNSLGSIFYLGCQWLITVLVVRLGSYEDAGNLSLAMAITNMFFTIASFGIRTFQVSDYKEKYKVSTYVTTRLFTCICATTLCTVVVLLNGHYTPYQAACIIVYMLFRVAEALVDSFQAIEQKAERMDYIFVSFLLRGILILVVFCGTMVFAHNLLAAIFAMALVSLCVVWFFDFGVVRRLISFRLHFQPAKTKALLLECFPLMCNSFLTAAIVSIPRSTLESLWGSYTLGIYASIATPAVIIQSAAQWIYAPTITTFTRHYVQQDKKSFYQLYRRLWATIGICVILVCIGAKLLGRWGLLLLFNEEIVEYSHLLLPVLLTTILIACSYFLSALLTITRHLKAIVLSNVISVVLVLIFSHPFVGQFGMDGVNYVIYLAMGINVLLLFIVLSSILRKHFKKDPR